MKSGRGGSRPGSGRPALGEGKRKFHGFKCSDEEWERIKALAKENGIKSVSKYLRLAALREID
ncbi:MAG: hypothetical protein A4E56_00116 [Pelotomaculum sp. PtaU1.Bin065]|nr:MAG: hypothetical protein A4E56_00116 [Pelotomaculum sp. PtaU1.Bin065]